MKNQYANKLALTISGFHAVSGPTKHREGQLVGGCNVASEASYWCNRRETSEIQAKAYSGQRGTRMRMCSVIYTMLVYTVYVHMCVAAVECET